MDTCIKSPGFWVEYRSPVSPQPRVWVWDPRSPPGGGESFLQTQFPKEASSISLAQPHMVATSQGGWSQLRSAVSKCSVDLKD